MNAIYAFSAPERLCKVKEKAIGFFFVFLYVIYQIRNRTDVKDIVYVVHLYFNDLSLRNTSKALFKFVTRSHTAIRDWIQKYNPQKLYYN